ncbi:TSN isoform 4 [Pan troglodytes]|uniref:Translin n=3 Tax=Hominidae TaxID=9604 RepID=A0A0J9YVW2_HUMAN|nr:translin [Homo sapiens]KAI4036099.1 translin [Homo sapiens]PNI53462.1 TSN isoform 4 [Pan troglodytes]PNJ58560.1 TSN isoform 4 [Pongo abelii]
MSVSEIFVELQGFLAAEQDIREEIRKVVQSLEQTAREILTLLQGVHQGAGFQDSKFFVLYPIISLLFRGRVSIQKTFYNEKWLSCFMFQRGV